jgi:FAD:protein FMN transferase
VGTTGEVPISREHGFRNSCQRVRTVPAIGLALTLGVFAVLITSACAAAEAESVNGAAWSSEQRLLYFGIPVQVRFTPANAQLAEEAWSYLVGIDAIFNDYHDDSEIGRINRGGPGTYTLSPQLAEAFTAAITLNRLSGGAFDITVGPLRRLYRQAEKDGHFPTAEAIAEARSRIGAETFVLDGMTLTVLKAGVSFDFGGLIKGMAVDHVMALLSRAGSTAALVQCGGETACFGFSPRGERHRLGIPDPLDPESLWCMLRDPGQGFGGSTSGNYRSALQIDGKEYYHVFDPRTGEPAATQVLSASVAFASLGHNGMADGLAKLGIIDPTRFLQVVQQQGGEGMVLVRLPSGMIEERRSPGWPAFCADISTPSPSVSP